LDADALHARMAERAPDTSWLLKAPTPGLIMSVAIVPGHEVRMGQELCVLEGMKMENVPRAERDGVVGEERIKPRGTVASDQVLLTFT
jgi:propionyl-CoA carboxylase alpha chain